MQNNVYYGYNETAVKVPYVNHDEVSSETRSSGKRSWKPFTVKTPFLIMVMVVLLSCIAALEVLVRRSIPYMPPSTQQNVRKRLVTTSTEFDAGFASETVTYSYYTNPDARVKIGTTTTTSNTVISSTTSVTTTTPITLSTYPNPDGRVKITTTSSVPSAVPSTDPGAHVKISTTTKAGQQSGTISDAPKAVTTMSSIFTSNGQIVTSIFVGTVTGTRTAVTSTQAGLSDKISGLSKPDLQVTGTFTYTYYFMALFLPSIIAVILRELWSVIACGVKLIEPFYCLRQPEGAKVQDSLMADYLSASSSWSSIKAAFRGSCLMIAVLIVNCVMSIAAPLASESMTAVVLNKYVDENGNDHRENLVWVLYQPILRVLQGLLGFVILAMILIAVLSNKRHSGLSGNPSKLATMASLLNHPNMVQEMQSIDPGASDSQISQALAHSRYTMTDYRDALGNERFGLVKVGETVPHGMHRVPLEDIASSLAHAGLGNDQDKSQLFAHIWRDGLSVVLIGGLLGTIVAYWLDGSDSAFNRFFNSGGFGPRFILSLVASTITTTFQNVEREVRFMTPYRRLAAGQARAKNTILRSIDGTAVSNLLQSIRQATWFHLFIAVTALLGDVLIIVVVGVPFGENITHETFVYSSYASMGITALMLIAIIMVFVWRRKNKKLNMPRKQNDTLIRVWMSMSNRGNQLRAMLEDAGDMKEGLVAARVRREGGSYWAGWVRDERGRELWCVDKEAEYLSVGHHW